MKRNKIKIKENNSFVFIGFAVFIAIQLVSLFILAELIVEKTNLLIGETHKLKAFEQRDISIDNLQKDYQVIKGDLEIIDLALPDKKGMISFINQLEKEASSSGISSKISFSSQSVKTEPKGLKNISFTLNLKGTYFKIVEFIKAIEKMPRMVQVEKIAIQSPNGIETENNVILTMKCYIDPEF